MVQKSWYVKKPGRPSTKTGSNSLRFFVRQKNLGVFLTRPMYVLGRVVRTMRGLRASLLKRVQIDMRPM
jgi:hypothetical protein